MIPTITWQEISRVSGSRLVHHLLSAFLAADSKIEPGTFCMQKQMFSHSPFNPNKSQQTCLMDGAVFCRHVPLLFSTDCHECWKLQASAPTVSLPLWRAELPPVCAHLCYGTISAAIILPLQCTSKSASSQADAMFHLALRLKKSFSLGCHLALETNGLY